MIAILAVIHNIELQYADTGRTVSTNQINVLESGDMSYGDFVVNAQIYALLGVLPRYQSGMKILINNNSFPRVGIEPTTISFTVTCLCHCITMALRGFKEVSLKII